MKNPIVTLAVVTAAFALTSSAVLAKDKSVDLSECPQPVQDVIKRYSAQATFEEVKLDKNAKTGGTATYEAKFSMADGRRFEVHISPAGSIMAVENKKARQ